jgi:hypothetical protein
MIGDSELGWRGASLTAYWAKMNPIIALSRGQIPPFDKKDCAEPTRWTDDVMTSTVALEKTLFGSRMTPRQDANSIDKRCFTCSKTIFFDL